MPGEKRQVQSFDIRLSTLSDATIDILFSKNKVLHFYINCLLLCIKSKISSNRSLKLLLHCYSILYPFKKWIFLILGHL